MTRALVILAVVLGALLAGAGARILALEKALSAKPKVELREVVKTEIRRVAGPVRVEEKIVQVPGGTRTIVRTVFRDAVTTNTGKESDTARSEAPACAPVTRHTRFVGPTFDAREGYIPDGARAGLTLFDRLDLAAGFRLRGRAQGPFADAALRF